MLCSIGTCSSSDNYLGTATTVKSGNYSLIQDAANASLSEETNGADKFYQYCIGNKVSNLDDFNHFKANYQKATGQDCSNLKFSDYMSSRGCSGPDELKDLNKTGFNTKQELIDWAMKTFKDSFDKFGTKVNTAELDTLISQTDVKDLANFYNSYTEAQSKSSETEKAIGTLLALGDFVGKLSQKEGLSTEMQKQLKGLSSAISSYVKLLQSELEKEKLEGKEAKKADDESNTQQTDNTTTQKQSSDQIKTQQAQTNTQDENDQHSMTEEDLIRNMKKFKSAFLLQYQQQ
jgi:hypothetical protein